MSSLSERLQEYLKKLGIGTPNPTATGFNRDYESGVQSGVRDLTSVANNFDTQRNLDLQDQTRSTSQLGESRDQTLKGLQQKFADQGILRSGINVEQQGKVGQDYTRGIDELARSISGRSLERENQFKSAQNRFQERLSELQQQRAERQAEQDAEQARQQAEIQARQQAEEAAKKAAQPQPTPTGRLIPIPAGETPVQTLGGEMPQWKATGFPTPDSYEQNRAQPDYDIDHINNRLRFFISKGWDNQAQVLLEGMLGRGIPPHEFDQQIMRRFGR